MGWDTARLLRANSCDSNGEDRTGGAAGSAGREKVREDGAVRSQAFWGWRWRTGKRLGLEGISCRIAQPGSAGGYNSPSATTIRD
jgi:hypothetical protein